VVGGGIPLREGCQWGGFPWFVVADVKGVHKDFKRKQQKEKVNHYGKGLKSLQRSNLSLGGEELQANWD